MRVLLLVDGLHNAELLGTLSRVISLSEVELLLVHMTGPHLRAGFELIRRRPGGHRLPPYRERGLGDAEQERGAGALAEAETLANPLARAVRALQVEGEPGQAVCEVATRDRVDLVVLRAGGPDRPPMGPHSLGPAARHITDHSPCPVLLLRGKQ